MTATRTVNTAGGEKPNYRHIPPQERLGMTMAQAAEYCGMTKDTLRPFVDRGEIAYRWKGRLRLIDRESLVRWWRLGLEGGQR